MRILPKQSYYCRQFGLVQRFGGQTQHRRDFGTTGGEGGTSAPAAGGSGGRCQQQAKTGQMNEEDASYPHIDLKNMGRIEVTQIQRAILGFGSALMSILDPKRADMIATMGETTVPTSLLKHIHQRMAGDISGAELLRKKPRINEETINRQWLSTLPDGTLGKEYMRFLDDLNTSPDARPPVHFVDDPELVYVMQRYRETHDFTHVLLQMRTNMLGEVTVKYFEAVQLGFPMCLAAAIFGPLRLGPIHRQQLLERNLPWVMEQAEKGRFLLALDWENRFEQTVADLQNECNIKPLALNL